MTQRRAWSLAVVAVFTGCTAGASPEAPVPVDATDRVVLAPNVHAVVAAAEAVGDTAPELRMERVILALRIPAAKQARLTQLLADQQDPASPAYHRWLSPEAFAEAFGPSPAEVAQVGAWLTAQGFHVDEVARSRTWIDFSGSVSQIESAFQTRIRDFRVGDRIRHANLTTPTMPRAVAGAVAGIVSLHDVPRRALNSGIRALSAPEYTSTSGAHYLSPIDFATIYNLNPLYAAGLDGTGQTIAVVGRTHPSATNWTTFRSLMALPARAPVVIVNGTDPGDQGANEDGEADLDVEWSGAVARNATVNFVISKSTASTDGVDLSAQYVVNHDLAPVMTTSFGACESQMGSAENTFFNNLWSQAAAQGITSFVSSGDSGASGCDGGSATRGTGRAVSGLASTPYNVAVGGSQFSEGAGTYWATSNGSGYSSALGYIPEVAWNESGSVSGGSGLWSTAGGVSTVYAKPSWQVAPGVPADGKRDVPDVSLTAASHDGYIVQTQGALAAIGGTSASSPALAGIMALVVQSTGQRQGNANPRLYQLAQAQYGAGGPAVFHDVIAGSNTVPGVTGYNAATGYDLATGVGTVDANALVAAWGGGTPTPDFAVSVSPAALSVVQGASGTSTVTTTVSGGFSGAVALSASGLPTGATASFSPASIGAPGAGSSTVTVAAGASTAAGTYTVTLTAASGSTSHTATLTLTVTASGGSGTVFTDGFEASGWSTAQVSGTAGAWTLVTSSTLPTASPHGGSKLAKFNSYTSKSGSQTRLYRSSAIVLPAGTVTLSFWMYHDTGYSTSNDRVQVQVSANGGSSWTSVGSAVSRYNGSTGWAKATVSLSGYAGQTVNLGFLGISAYGNNVYLDDVAVTSP